MSWHSLDSFVNLQPEKQCHTYAPLFQREGSHDVCEDERERERQKNIYGQAVTLLSKKKKKKISASVSIGIILRPKQALPSFQGILQMPPRKQQLPTTTHRAKVDVTAVSLGACSCRF